MDINVRRRFLSFLQQHISDRILLIAGLITIPAFLLQEQSFTKLLMCLLFIVLVFLENKRVRVVLPFAVFLSVVVMNLFRPYGTLLFTIAGLRVTWGALLLGIKKASTFVGLIYLSRFFVRPSVSIPGKIGALLARTFYFFDLITEKWPATRGKTLFERLDNLFFSIETSTEPRSRGEKRTTTIYGLGFLLLIMGFIWTLLFFPFPFPLQP